jgi:hypothetical protein
MPFLQPQMQDGVDQFRTRITVVKGRTITASAIAWSNSKYFVHNGIQDYGGSHLIFLFHTYTRKTTLRLT